MGLRILSPLLKFTILSWLLEILPRASQIILPPILRMGSRFWWKFSWKWLRPFLFAWKRWMFSSLSVTRYVVDVYYMMWSKKIVPVQTRFAFARILATAGSTVTHSIPPLMSNLLEHFEPSELVDFMNFIGLLIHKLQVRSLLFNTLIDICSTCITFL